jgi:hypothetical protein
MVVPGGGIALDGQRWVAARPAFLLPVRVLGKLFRGVFLSRLLALYDAGRLGFFGSLAQLADRRAFLRHLAPVRKKRWAVYAKPPFAGPAAVLAYLSRYTHRVAISNRRLLAFDDAGVTFRYKDYRRDGGQRPRVMTLATDEFIRRFLMHVLPRGFHRIRHYGLLAASARKVSLARARELLAVAPPPADEVSSEQPRDPCSPCPCCGGQMVVIEIFTRWCQPRAPPRASRSAEEVSPRPGTDRTTPAPQRPRSGDQPMSRLISQLTPQRSPLASTEAHTPSKPRTATATKRVGGHVAVITPPRPASAKIPNPHRPRPARRGFVPPRLSYAFGARNSQGSRFLPVRLQARKCRNQTSSERQWAELA